MTSDKRCLVESAESIVKAKLKDPSPKGFLQM